MAELTREQLDAAVKVAAPMIAEDYCTEDVVRAAAPYLQLPWDEPTDEECREFVGQCVSTSADSRLRSAMNESLGEFVRRRNAALITKPENPFVKDALANLQGVTLTFEEASKIVAAVWPCVPSDSLYRNSEPLTTAQPQEEFKPNPADAPLTALRHANLKKAFRMACEEVGSAQPFDPDKWASRQADIALAALDEVKP